MYERIRAFFRGVRAPDSRAVDAQKPANGVKNPTLSEPTGSGAAPHASQPAAPDETPVTTPKRPTRTFTEFFAHVKSLGFNPGTVIDVGVAKGTPPLYQAFPDSYFILVEPVEEFIPHLQEITQKYRGEYHTCALMAEAGEATILRTRHLHASSMMHRVQKEDDERLQKVRKNTLDDLIGDRDLDPEFLLKTDCQGSDFDVLKGGTATLQKCELVIVETSFFKFWGDHHPDPLDILNFMADQGFVIYDFLDGLFRPHDNALGQIDIVFVKRHGRFRKVASWS